MEYAQALQAGAASIALVFSIVVSGNVYAAECAPRILNQTKPPLHGTIEDRSRNLGLMWRSTAGKDQTDGSWTIDNSICNTGAMPLIVDWPKTGLGNDAYSPLPSGMEMHNDYGGGTEEPVSGAAPLIYGGYTGRPSETQIYQMPPPSKKNAALRSSISGTFAQYDPITKQVKTGASFEAIDLQVQVTPAAGGYKFVIVFKNNQPDAFSLAVSSEQNNVFAEILEKNGIKTIGIIPLRKIIGDRPEGSAFRAALDRPFVVMPMLVNKEPLNLFIPSKATNIEVATAVVLKGAIPIMIGKVSLLQ